MDRFTKDLLLLNMVREIGYIRLQVLLKTFQTPSAILEAKTSMLEKVKGIGRGIAEAINTVKERYDIEREISLVHKHNVKIKTIFDEDYPVCLRNIYNPPIVLYIRGELKKRYDTAIAIVGSRRSTLHGTKTAKRLAGGLVANGVAVISGLARGIDTASHKGAIAAGGRTIAVLGNGLMSIYPVENKSLAEEIIRDGAVVCEYPMEMPPHKINFPMRNRIIAGLSQGVVIVEAGKSSGALITADFALEQGKDVFAVPGAVGSLTSEGTNGLIKQGAKLVENAEDILEGLGIDSQSSCRVIPKLTDPAQRRLYEVLSDKPHDIDTIMSTLCIDHKDLQLGLLNLEMRGIVKQLPGKLYVRA